MKYRYKSSDNKYEGIDFSKRKIVDAQYSKSSIEKEWGNPFVEGLPELIPKDILAQKCYVLISGYNQSKVNGLSLHEKESEIMRLQDVRIPLPHVYQMYVAMNMALKTSYTSRKLHHSQVSLVMNDKDEKVSGIKTLPDDSGDHSNGFTLIGASGCGKTTSLKMLFEQFPQLIIHKNNDYGEFLQIVYIKVNCFPNSNLSELLNSIGKQIDNLLNNRLPVYEEAVRKAKTIGKKIAKICTLIEVFNIGALVLDEIQLMDFDSNKESSFEAILTIANNTKIAVIVVGTEDAYEKMFPNLRTSRRTGVFIDATSYSKNREFVSKIIKLIWQYQWWDEYIPEIPKDVEDGLILISKGIIDQIIKIYMYMQLEYVRSKNKPQIDMEFISNVVKKSFPGTLIHLKNLSAPDSVDEKEESLTIIEQNAFTKIKEYLSISGLIYNEKSIINAIKIVSKRNPNADVLSLTKSAVSQLKRKKSDARPKQKKMINYEEQRDELLETTKQL